MQYLKSFYKRIYDTPFLFYTLIALIVFWPVSGLIYSLQYDMIDVVLPWRYFAGECFQNGIFPYWNPYQQCGYPIFADMQYPFWYPEVYIIGFLFGYSNITLHFLYLLYTILGGLGMYKLAKEFKIDYHFSLLAGLVFMFSSIFIGHAQSLVSILGATWLPWVIAYYLRMIKNEFSWGNIFKFCLVTFLMLTGGYQAVSFMLFYLLLIYFMFRFVQIIFERKLKTFKEFIYSHLLSIIIILFLLAGSILSVTYAISSVSRLEGLSLEGSQKFILHPKSLLSFLNPFAALKLETTYTDISITNCFVGVITILFGIAALLKKLPKEIYILLVFSFVFLLASFGAYTPVQGFFYKHLPLMDLFRFPAFYRYFFIISIIISALYYLNKRYSLQGIRSDKLLSGLIVLAMVYYAINMAVAFPDVYFRQNTFINSDIGFIEKFRNSTLGEALFFQSLVQFVLYLVFLFLLWLKRFQLRNLIFLFLLLELVFAAQLNIPVTVVGNNKPSDIKEYITRSPKGFPIPDRVPLYQNSDKFFERYNLWLNLGNFSKQISWEGYTSFDLDNRKMLDETYPVIKDSVLSNEFIYLTNDVRPISDSISDFTSKTLFLADYVYNEIDMKDSITDNAGKIAVVAFQPNRMEFEIICQTSTWMVLLQSYFKGWEVLVDDMPVPAYNGNVMFDAIQVPSGNHKVVFTYSIRLIQVLFYLSLAGFLTLLILVSFHVSKNNKVVFLLISIGLMAGIILFIVKRNEVNTRDDKISHIKESSEIALSNPPENLINFVLWDSLNQAFLATKNEVRIQRVTPEIIDRIGKIFSSGDYLKATIYRINKSLDPNLVSAVHYFMPGIEEGGFSDPNSGVLKFSPDNAEERFPMFDNKGHWHIREETDSLVYYQNPPSLYVDSTNIFVANFAIDGMTIPEGKNRILYVAGFIKWQKPGNVYAVIDIPRKHYDNIYCSVNLQDFGLDSNWVFFTHGIYLPDKLQVDGELKMYIWNPENSIFSLSDLKVDYIIPKE
ncbi:MAG: hypothetical protein JXB49_17660 [Bacteroidales bacterium]|nr:hypothetical protein [Bacteroidales bacterium]